MASDRVLLVYKDALVLVHEILLGHASSAPRRRCQGISRSGHASLLPIRLMKRAEREDMCEKLERGHSGQKCKRLPLKHATNRTNRTAGVGISWMVCSLPGRILQKPACSLMCAEHGFARGRYHPRASFWRLRKHSAALPIPLLISPLPILGTGSPRHRPTALPFSRAS